MGGFKDKTVAFVKKHPKGVAIGAGVFVVLAIIGSITDKDKKNEDKDGSGASKPNAASSDSTVAEKPAGSTPAKDGPLSSSPEDVAKALAAAGNRGDVWEREYKGKLVHWAATYERTGTLVKFVASTGDLSALSCKGFGSAHDASKFKGVEEGDQVQVDGRLEKEQKQLGKSKTEFVLTDCTASISSKKTSATAAGGDGSGWAAFPQLKGDMLWPLAGPVPGDDEFARNENKSKRSALAAELKTKTFLFAASDEELGEYDFKKGAFPVTYNTVTRDGAPSEDHVEWNVCVCTPKSEVNVMDGTPLVNQTHEWQIYRWGEKQPVIWLPVPEGDAKAFADEHRGHIDVYLLVQVAGVAEDKKHYFTDAGFKENAMTGGLISLKSLGPVQITGRRGRVLLDTLSKYPAIK